MTQLRSVFTTPDGKIFETKAEALNHMRRPKIEEAMNKLTGNNKELTEWLIDNAEVVEDAADTGKIRRVSKADRKKLEKALQSIKEANNPAFAFIADNAGAVLDSFHWPKVKRMTPEETAVAVRNTIVAASEGNEDLANWVVANMDAILEAYKAGEEKRAVNPNAAAALAEYQAKKKAEKEAAAAAAAQ